MKTVSAKMKDLVGKFEKHCNKSDSDNHASTRSKPRPICSTPVSRRLTISSIKTMQGVDSPRSPFSKELMNDESPSISLAKLRAQRDSICDAEKGALYIDCTGLESFSSMQNSVTEVSADFSDESPIRESRFCDETPIKGSRRQRRQSSIQRAGDKINRLPRESPDEFEASSNSIYYGVFDGSNDSLEYDHDKEQAEAVLVASDGSTPPPASTAIKVAGVRHDTNYASSERMPSVEVQQHAIAQRRRSSAKKQQSIELQCGSIKAKMKLFQS